MNPLTSASTAAKIKGAAILLECTAAEHGDPTESAKHLRAAIKQALELVARLEAAEIVAVMTCQSANDKWPRNPDGSIKSFRDLTFKEQEAITKDACTRLIKDFDKPAVQRAILAILQADG